MTEGTAAAQTVADHSFSPAALEYGQTYYWRVDEVNEARRPARMRAPSGASPRRSSRSSTTSRATTTTRATASTSSGSTAMTDQSSGSTGRLLRGPVRRADDHPRRQAVDAPGLRQHGPALFLRSHADLRQRPRTGPPTASRASRSSSRARPATAGKLYLKINNTKVPYNGGAADIAKPAWLPWNIDLSTVGGNLSKVTIADDRHRGLRRQGHPVPRRHPALSQDPGVHHAGRAGQGESAGSVRLRGQRQRHLRPQAQRHHQGRPTGRLRPDQWRHAPSGQQGRLRGPRQSAVAGLQHRRLDR